MMKLLGSTEKKIAKDENRENVPHLETTEIIAVRCNIVYNSFQQDLVSYQRLHQQMLYF